MATTFELISSVTVGSGGASYMEFTSIPSTFTDLIVKFSARSNDGYQFDRGSITFNGTTSGYSWREIGGDSGTVSSSNYASQSSLFNVTPSINGGTSTSSVFSNAELYIPNYTSSANKSINFEWRMPTNSAAYYLGFDAGLSTITSAITSIKIAPTLGSLVQYSTAYLYGVKNA